MTARLAACRLLVAAAGCVSRSTGAWRERAPLPTPHHDLEAVVFGGRIHAISGAGDLTTGVRYVLPRKLDEFRGRRR